MDNNRLRAEYVEHLYGVPRNERRELKHILNTAALFTQRKVVDSKPLIPSPFLIFGATTEAETYGYRQRGDYMFSLKVPAKIIDIVVRELESLTPTCDDISPRDIVYLRRRVMEDINLIPKIHEERYNEDLGDAAFVRYLERFSETRRREKRFDIASTLISLASQIEMVHCDEAKVLELKVSTNFKD